jgi:hypothetical protein
VTDSAAATDDLPTFTLVVDAAGTLAISGAPVTSAVEDEAYDGFTASAANGTPPYVYSLQGSWPTGITIDSSTGVVSGTPTSSGSFTSLSVRVTDDVAATDDLPTFTLVVETTGGFAWPNASNTGYSGALTAYSGPNPITVDGTVVQDKHITASIEVVADDVQFLNCWIDYTDAFGVQGSGATGLLIEDCTFTAHGGNAPILSGVSATIRRCNLSGAENGIVLQDGAHLVELNYLHDLDNSDPLGHPDGISVQGGQNGTVIQDNHIEACGTSAVFLKCDFGSIINTTIYHNRLKNMGVVDNDMYRFAVYSITGPHGTPTGTIISNNIIQQGFFGGYWATDGSVTITGNIDYDTGNPI